MRASKTVMAVGGVAIAAALIGFTNPKTVHALTAALVQVTNTAANPVVDAEVTKDPSRIVELWCFNNSCVQLQPGGYRTGTANYTVPAGQTLVITDMQFTTTKDSDSTLVGIYGVYPDVFPLGFVNSIQLTAPDDGLTHVLQMQRGSVFASGQELSVGSNISPAPVVLLHGYLANASQ